METPPTPRATTNPHAPPSQKLRLLISYNGHILPRPHDKTLTYMGGDTRLIICDKSTTTLQTLIHKIHKTTSFSAPFVIKYQLPSEDLDTLVNVGTDEDLECMIEEYFLFNSLNCENKLRLFLFPRVSDSEFVESVKSLGSVLLEGSEKSEEVFVKGLNGRLSSCLSFCENNSLLGLDDDVIKGEVKEKEKEEKKVVVVQDVMESPGFGSVPDSPVVVKEEGNYVAVKAVEAPVVVETVKEVVNLNYVAVQDPMVEAKDPDPMVNYVAVQAPVKVVNGEVKEEVSYVAVQAPMVEAKVSGNGVGANGLVHRVSSGLDMASPDSVLSDGSLTNPLSRRNPPVIYQDAATQTQYSNNNNNGVTSDQNARTQMQQQQIHAATQTQYSDNNVNGVTDDQNSRIQMQMQQLQVHDSVYLSSTSSVAVTTTTQTDLQHPQAHQQHQFIHTTDPSSINDQNTRIHQQQQQQIHDSAYLTSTAAPSTTAATKTDLQHPQVHQQHQFIHTAVPQPQYIHHHPSGAVPMAPYYTIYPPQNQHHVPVSALDQHKIVYYMPVTAPPNSQVPTPSSLFTTPRTVKPSCKPESPIYRTNSSGASGPQFVQVPSSQHQHQPQPQYVAYSHIQQPSQAVASSGGIEPPSKPESPVYRTNSSGTSGPQFVQAPSSQHQHQPPQPQYVAYSHIQQPSQAVASSDAIEPSSKPESPVYRTNSSGASGPQFVQVPSSQHQHKPQPQYVAYSHIQQPSQAVASSGGSGGKYAYEFADLSQPGQLIYYAAQPMPPQSSAQYQTMSSNLPVEGGSHIQKESSMNQQVKTSQP